MKSNLLKAERIKHGWTQAKVAEEVGVDAKTVGRWEQGRAFPYPYHREQLCLLFGKTAQQLGILSADELDILQDAISLDIQSPGTDTLVQVSFLADPTIPYYLESPTSLVGHHRILMEVKERLLTGDNVALTAGDGLPGVGKTALAGVLAMDQQVRDHFCDGILWAGLGSHASALRHLIRWGMLLGVIPDQVKNTRSREAWLQALQAAIGTRRMLLIIDDAWTVEDALSLQVGGTACAHLVTTRFSEVALAFDQEGGITIGQLEEMERIDLLSRFVPDLVQQDPQGVLMLVEEVGGLPLALTLMGSYLVSQGLPAQSHSLQIALALLRDIKETLHVRMPGVPEEGFASLGETMPQSLYAVIAMCDQRLSPQAHITLHALTTFLPKPESFSLDAALAVTQQPVETLDELCDTGLLETGGPGRYLLHQAVADYVRIQGKFAAMQEKWEGVADSWHTNFFGKREKNALSVPILASQIDEQKSPESAIVTKRQLGPILISKQGGLIRSTWIEPVLNMVKGANRLLLQEQKILPSSHYSPTLHSSTINPQMKPPVQEGKSRPRPLGRRSILIGLVGGIIAIGGGVFMLDKLTETEGSGVIAQENKTIPAQPRAGSSTRWTGPQWIAGQGSRTTPALALSSNRILHLVFVANDDNHDLLCLSSKDSGATWGTYHAVRQSSKAAPALALSSNGILHLVFVANNRRNGLLYTFSQDNGETWSHNALIGQDSKRAPALAASSNGILHLVFVANSDGNGLMYMSSQDYGATWDDALYTGQASKAAPALVVSSNRILHLVFIANNDSNGLMYMSSQDHGATWNKMYPTEQSSLCAPALAVLNNTLYLAFVASDGSNQICIISSQDGIHWSTKQETGQSSLCAPALLVLNNTLYLAFVASDGSNQICIISSHT